MANAVLDTESGNMLECRHLIKHSNPAIHNMWTNSVADGFGRLFQCVGKGNKNGQRVKGTNTFYFTPHHQVPQHNTKDTACARIFCAIREMKKNKCRTRITVGGNTINHDGDVGTPTGRLETTKLLFNSVL